MNITLAQAESAIASATERAGELGISVSVAVLDTGGNLVAIVRQDNAILVSLDMAIGKAYTSVFMQCPTGDLTAAVQPGGPFFNFDLAHTPRPLITFAGGQPIGSPMIGAIGVSGGTAEQDNDVALAGMAALQ
ncbi:hypothetical protein CH298_02440 [Rhodococcoides fascians]|uniref:GlcG/HbpS family heme-binding protein n=1 Tax=Rhodococcoides fascians TaxID=1828 RepID=UPI000B9A78F7|nr:heme-binding protein [Rhodococcus fascians]OZE92418.1 hypothetical protein CH303_02440 [Rhodococcus fascians]OZF23051.1 hypothetical protein CH298_02440 [Rhodococcus fascians]OZF24765.1 hypothetical protein CH297_02440 [Rhodococcus fascians]OZF73014.1 hypothetical protein CH308_02445 [Rhodococcus fascians]OZF74179.1 hypothetical protein CH307_02440 [Rhodococcus fascians]